MGSHDRAQIAARDAADPERAIVTALERAERAAPGSLSPEALARVAAWRAAELARKTAEREAEAKLMALAKKYGKAPTEIAAMSPADLALLQEVATVATGEAHDG